MIEGDLDVNELEQRLQLLPKYNGQPNLLKGFVAMCEEIIDEYVRPTTDDIINSLILQGIRNKLIGAADTLIGDDLLETNKWEDFKAILLDKFADHRDEAELCADLCLLTQGERPTQAFYENIQTLFDTIMSYVAVNEELPSTILAKRKLYKKISLHTFVSGLNEPLRSRVQSRKPETLGSAFQYATVELNAMHSEQHAMQHNRDISLRYNVIPRNNNLPQCNTVHICPPIVVVGRTLHRNAPLGLGDLRIPMYH